METNKLEEAIEKVLQQLRNMSEEELKKEIEIHKNGDIAQILLEVNYFGNDS